MSLFLFVDIVSLGSNEEYFIIPSFLFNIISIIDQICIDYISAFETIYRKIQHFDNQTITQ